MSEVDPFVEGAREILKDAEEVLGKFARGEVALTEPEFNLYVEFKASSKRFLQEHFQATGEKLFD